MRTNIGQALRLSCGLVLLISLCFERVLNIVGAVSAALPASADDLAKYEGLAREWKVCCEACDFPSAETAADKLLRLAQEKFGADDWRTTDARVALSEAQSSKQLSADDAKRLKAALQQMRQEAVLYADGKYDEALKAAREAADVRRAILGEKHRDYLESFLEVAVIEQDLQKFDDAERDYQKVSELLKGLFGDNHPAYANAQNELGTLLDWRGNKKEAVKVLERALEIRGATLGENSFDYGRTLNNLGSATVDLKSAEGYFRRALEVFRAQKSDPKLYVPRLEHNLARNLLSQGRYQDAEPLFLESLEAFRKAYGDQHPDPARVMQTLGGLYMELGDFAKAEANLRGAEEIIRKVFGDEHFRLGHTLDNLTWVLKEEGNYEEAERVGRQALQIWSKVHGEKSHEYANALNSLGNIYRDQRNFEKADEYLQGALKAEETSQGKTSGFYATILQNLALLNDDQGKFEVAEPYYLEALEIYRKAGESSTFASALTLSNFGLLRFHQGRTDEAEKLYLEALDLFKKTVGERHPRSARTQRNLATLKRSRSLMKEADALYRQSLENQTKLVDAAAMGQSERQQLAMAARFREYLDNYLSFSISTGEYVEYVYEFALRWKGAVFMRQRAQRALAARPDLAPLADQLRTTTQELSHLALATPDPKRLDEHARRIGELTIRQEELQRRLALQSQAFRDSTRPFEAQGLRDALPDGALLVDFWEYDHFDPPQAGVPGLGKTERRIAAFVLRKNLPTQLISLGAAAPVRIAAESWRKDYGGSSSSEQAGEALRSQVWDPLEKLFDGAKFILVSPDGVMGTVPFGALPGKGPDSYLLQNWAVSIVPVPQSIPILLHEQRQEPRGELLLLGNVNYDSTPEPEVPKAKRPRRARSAPRFGAGDAFPEIEHTKFEIEALAGSYKRRFDGDGVTVLEQLAANEEAFRKLAPEHRYVHVATHGFFAPPELRSALENLGSLRQSGGVGSIQGFGPGLLSGLALAGANHPSDDGDDGILTADEAESLDLSKVNLVVLSACETGLGEVAGGEGLLGLQRAFQVAGAGTVVACMWKVDDEQTRVFMTHFYEHLWENEDQDMLTAFRETQLWMMKEGPRTRDVRLGPPPPTERKTALPFYWGAFVLSGDWR